MPPRKSGLGRGLDALLPSSDRMSTGDVEQGALRHVSVDAIVPNPNQPRQVFDEAGLAELTASVEELGILQPLLVRESGPGRYELIAGERRYRAAREAGLELLPVLLVETDDRGSMERALVENIHREDLDALEEAAAYKALLDEGGLTQDALAKRLGRSPQAISNSLRLLDLPTGLQRLVHDRLLSGGHARALMGLQGSPFQERAAHTVVADQLSVRATEALVRNFKEKFEPATTSSTGARPQSAVAVDSERRLKDRLQTKVQVQVSKRRRRIIIDAASDEDLARITSVIVGDEAGGETSTVSPG